MKSKEEIVNETRQQLIARGVISAKSGAKIDPDGPRDPSWPTHCLECNEKLPARLKKFCSGQCMNTYTQKHGTA